VPLNLTYFSCGWEMIGFANGWNVWGDETVFVSLPKNELSDLSAWLVRTRPSCCFKSSLPRCAPDIIVQ
jgi:hypothetical protein